MRLVGYDNERGKGDHKHIGVLLQGYVFQSVEQLLDDFWNDVKTLSGQEIIQETEDGKVMIPWDEIEAHFMLAA